jgi:enamine deaminase RidA (YjgF/YER057c/UK114 family)
MGIERIPGAGSASFSKAVIVSGAGRTVYVSGNISPRGSMADQANGCIDEIEAALRAVGGSLEHVVRITAWLTSLDQYGEYNRVRGERFGANLPASAAVQVAGLLRAALIEIDAVAFIPD